MFAVAAVLLCVVSISWAGGIGPEAAMMGHGTLSPMGLDNPDATNPSTVSPNPACLVSLAAAGWPTAAELDLGLLNFESRPSVTADVQTVLWSDGRSHYRIMRYGIRSGSSPMPLLLPEYLSAKFTGESIQLSYAKDMGNWAWGVSLFPKNQTDTEVTIPNVGPMVSLRADSRFAGRAGATWNPRPDVTIGGYWHYESDRATATFWGDYPGGSVTDSASYIGSYQTIGASWAPRLGTTLFANYQRGRLWGRDLDSPTSLWFGGVTQYLSPKWNLTAYDLDNALGVSVNHFSKNWNIGASYSPEALQSSRDVMGDCEMIYLWAAKSW